jgi:hypothetical protein
MAVEYVPSRIFVLEGIWTCWQNPVSKKGAGFLLFWIIQIHITIVSHILGIVVKDYELT